MALISARDEGRKEKMRKRLVVLIRLHLQFLELCKEGYDIKSLINSGNIDVNYEDVDGILIYEIFLLTFQEEQPSCLQQIRAILKLAGC